MRRHLASISFSTEALTTALSNDSDTSSTPSTRVIHNVPSVPAIVPVYSQPIHAAIVRHSAVNRIDPL